MANTWTLEEALSFHNSKAIAGDYHADDDNNNNNDDYQALKTWMMMQDELVQDGYLNCMFEHQPPHPLSSHKGALSLPAMTSTPPVLPSPPPPPLNFGQFSRPVADAKALLQMAAFGRRMKLNDLHINPNGVVPEVSVSALSSTDSNVGLAHQHPQISLPIRKDLPCLPQGLGGAAAARNSLSASCLEKTHNESAVHPSVAMLPSTEKEIPCPHKGFKDAVAPLNSTSANSRYHSELKTHNESAMDPLTAISTSVGKDLPSLRQGLTSAIALNSSSANSANCSDKTHKESHAHPSNEEIDPEADAEKLSLRRNTGSSLKRARVPELHNKSEKRRRDKINEKMRALQQLIPNSGKTDKSSILDEAIEYLKYLQFQIQYMWMQSGMDPRPLMLFTGMQAPKAYHQPPYLQQMGMSTGLMGMDMAMGFGTSIGHPSNHMATMQTIPGQRIPSSQQLHSNSSFFNATNGYDSMQSSAVNTTYGTHFPHSEHHQQ